MSGEGGINGNGHAGRMVSIVEARVVQRRADDSQRLDPEGPQALAGLAKCRDRTSTEWTVEPPVQAKEERTFPAIVGEGNRPTRVHHRQREVRCGYADFEWLSVLEGVRHVCSFTVIWR